MSHNELQYVEGSFLGERNYRIHYRCWLPHVKTEALLLIVPGLAEHSGRYQKLADHFVPLNYGVFALDHQGHGKSEGLPGYIIRFEDYVLDLNTFSTIIRAEYPNPRIFMVGHSMGGAIAAAYAIRHQAVLTGLVLSAATLKVGRNISNTMTLMARGLSRLLPRLGLESIDASAISRDPTVVAAYREDPLVYHGKIRARLGGELINAMRKIRKQMPQLKLPVLIMHGSADRLSDPAGSEMLYRGISSSDRTLNQYPGCYHEIFNEPQCQALGDLKNWLSAHLK